MHELEKAFGIPQGTTQIASVKERVKTIETAMSARTAEIELKTAEVLSIKEDGNLEVQVQVDRSKEYLRYQAVSMYESVSEMLVMIKSELMPGAQPAMWTAYSNLIRTALECHKRIGDVYRQLEESYGLNLPTSIEDAPIAENTKKEMTVENLMNLLEESVRLSKPLDHDKAIEVAAEEVK